MKITKRPDGRYGANVPLGRDPATGKYKRRFVCARTKKELKEKIKAVERSIALGEISPRNDQNATVKSWSQVWTDTYLGSLQPRTVRSYKSHIDNHIIPELGSKRLESLSPVDVQRFINRLSESGLSPKTIKNIDGTLHKLLDQACTAGLIAKNPADNVNLPRRKRPELDPFSESEIPLFLEAIRGDKFELLFRLEILTGLRLSEIIALRWSDIGRDRITVRNTFGEQKYDTVFYPTKSDKSRDVPVGETAREIITAIRWYQPKQAQAAFTMDTYAFVTDRMQADSADKLDALYRAVSVEKEQSCTQDCTHIQAS